MTDTTNLTPETALQTVYISLYPNLSDEDLPTLDQTSAEETYIDLTGNPTVSEARGEILASLETHNQIENSKTQTRQSIKKLEEEKKAAHKVVGIIQPYIPPGGSTQHLGDVLAYITLPLCLLSLTLLLAPRCTDLFQLLEQVVGSKLLEKEILFFV